MKHFTEKLLVGALVVAVAAIGATPAGAAKGGTDRPLTVSGSGTNLFEAPPVECDFAITDRGPALVCDQFIELDVKGTHLGKSTYSGEGELTIYVDPAEACTTPDGLPGATFDSVQTVTIVAANGDQLTADTVVSGCGDGVGLAEPAGAYEITGGTGRFAGATGHGTVEGVAIGTSLSSTWIGTISY
jgi:hypothetical protein